MSRLENIILKILQFLHEIAYAKFSFFNKIADSRLLMTVSDSAVASVPVLL